METSRTPRTLLLAGVVAGPLYLAAGLIQGLTRTGFDLARHPLSGLANGPAGFVQTANFVLTGALVIAAAAGFWRAGGPRSGPRLRAAAVFLGLYGACLLAAAV